jgi:putative ABC transport system substrate-binding protein
LAAELVSLKVDIIVAYQTLAAHAAKDSTNQTPIIMVGAGDPVGTGLITNFSRPDGNVTGIRGLQEQLGAKLVDFIRELLPSVYRVAVLANASAPFATPFLAQIERAARTIGIETQPVMVGMGDEFEATFESMRERQVDAVIIQPSLLRKGAELALKHQLPSFSISRRFPENGGLMSYGANLAALPRETAVYVDKILKGSKPAELPVAQPAKFDLVINLKTAKALGIAILPTLLERADEVIE